MKITIENQSFDFDAVANLMDDDLREQLHETITPCVEQVFVDAYCQAHIAKFGNKFTIN